MSCQSDTVCTPEDLANPGIYCYTRRENLIAVVVPVAGFISLIALLTIFALIARNVIRRPQSRLVRYPMDVYVLSLFTGDLVQAVGAILQIRWIDAGKVQVGSFCTVQGSLGHLGQTAVAITTIIITLHTFATIWWQKGDKAIVPVKFAWIIAGAPWISLLLFIIISASRNSPFYAPSLYWCWVSHNYLLSRLFGELAWLWFALLSSLLYIPLLLWAKGYITPSKWSFKVHTRQDMGNTRKLELVMIICAFAYFIPVLPMSIVRWSFFTHYPPAITAFVASMIFNLSGAFDVLVFLLARRGLLLFEKDLPPDASIAMIPDPMESQQPLLGHISDSGGKA